jgi:hypothetical protein
MTQALNQFIQTPVLGQMDLRFNGQTFACEVDAGETGELVAGQSVKLVDSAGGVPKVVAVTSDSDLVFGFIKYSIKDTKFTAGMAVEISTAYGNCIYLRATAAIARGAILKGVVASVGGVATAVQGSGSQIIGWAFDKAAADGDLIRVMINCPSYFRA